jgi:3-dehydroquinate synthase
MTISVPVALGDRSYHIHIGDGVLKDSGELLLQHLGKSAPRNIPVVTDETVAKIHYPAFAASLAAAGLMPSPIVLAPGEQTKSFSGLERLIDLLLDQNIERGSLIVALGGGVIGDLTGFAAGVVKRGVDFAQVPTTLLAQVDSSVGGKTAINTAQGKNLVGLFYQPRIVIADTAVLSTLPKRELLGGYAEIVKYGLLGDADFFAWLENNGAAALTGDGKATAHAVAHSCSMKAAIVAKDEREEGDRALLNLGHTFGHGLEAATHYSDRLIHGESVALGCVLAFNLSAKLGHASADDVARIERHFARVGLPTRLTQIGKPPPTPDEVLAHMRHDKKVRGGRMTFILAKGIGHAFISREVPEDAVRAVLSEG